jgi:integrase
LPGWFAGLEAVRGEGGEFVVSVCDLVEMALLTGLRRGELLSLTWDHVCLRDSTYYLAMTKNGDPLELPLTAHVRAMMERRIANGDESPYVFSAPNQYGQIKEPKKVIAQIAATSEIDFTLHDLRRTFTTTAESLNVGAYTIKRLLNHRTRRDDVTAGYLVLTPEELREPAQRIESAILAKAGVGEPEGVGVDAVLANMLVGLSEADKRALILTLSEKSNTKETVPNGR